MDTQLYTALMSKLQEALQQRQEWLDLRYNDGASPVTYTPLAETILPEEQVFVPPGYVYDPDVAAFHRREKLARERAPTYLTEDTTELNVYAPAPAIKLALDAFYRQCESHRCSVHPGFQGVFKRDTGQRAWKIQILVDCRNMRYS
jgi:hypothetical protein